MTDLATPELVQETSNALAVAKDFRVTTQDQYIASADRLKAIKALSKKLDETFDPHIKRAFDAHRALVAEKKQHQQPLIDAEGYVKRAIRGYEQDQERIRLAVQAKAQEEARKERERLEAQAARAAEKGKAEKAQALQAAAAAVVAPIIAPTTPKIPGQYTRTTYRAEVTDKLALIKAVAAGSVPMTALEPSMPFLNNQARVLREDLIYPGVRVVTESGIASRSA